MSDRMHPRRPARTQRPTENELLQGWRDGWEPARVLERNGNLTYVEFNNGRRDWLSPHEFN